MGDMADDAMDRMMDDDEERDEAEKNARHNEWAGGHHTTSKGDQLLLTSMHTPHLQNTINKFKREGYDTSALEEELAKRNKDN